MKKFIRYWGEPFFYRYLEIGEDIDFTEKLSNKDKVIRCQIQSGISKITKSINVDKKLQHLVEQAESQKLQFVETLPLIDYKALSEKYQTPILVNEKGGWRTIAENREHEVVFSNHFPQNSSKIVVCENDDKAEDFWLDYLNNKFKDQITVINHFSTRSDIEIKQAFSKAQYITFSTTFSSYDWFESLIRCAKKGQKILGYAHIEENIPHKLVNDNKVLIIKDLQ